jgi:hypothetical protein
VHEETGKFTIERRVPSGISSPGGCGKSPGVGGMVLCKRISTKKFMWLSLRRSRNEKISAKE